MPAPQRDEEGNTTNIQINNMSPKEQAIRVAYALRLGIESTDPSVKGAPTPEPVTLDQKPAPAPEPEPESPAAPRFPFPAPETLDPARQRWAQDLAATEDEALVADTRRETLETLPGSAAEQGRGTPTPPPTKRRPGRPRKRR